ncbi:MAG: hypothetical protein A3H91_14215 [Gammaproteobacteria bacterium RIFCSPLOWO2_02_FULL_61_13]|nr:MAG: hypothetical protein A3H91_14215 [Gammaproteobacteria bacterium RIFCSPLOWO2_02_FULL_61_13]
MPRDAYRDVRRYGYRDVPGRVEPGAETESDAGAKAEDRMSGAAGIQAVMPVKTGIQSINTGPRPPCRSTGQASPA